MIESINSPEHVEIILGGRVKIVRRYVPTKSYLEGSFTLYTHITPNNEYEFETIGTRRSTKASIVILHGNSENSDMFLEVGIHHALNGFEAHLIDLKG